MVNNSHLTDEAVWFQEETDFPLPGMFSSFPVGFSISLLVRVCLLHVTFPWVGIPDYYKAL